MPDFRQQTLGQLNCVVFDVEPDSPPEQVVVLCHGFGASGEDLVPLGPELVRMAPEGTRRTRFVFPAGPLDLSRYGMPGGRAWWPIDMQKLQMAAMRGMLRDLRHESPPELPAARAALQSVLTELLQQTGLPMSRFVLGGFSQGAMVTTDAVLMGGARPAGLVVYSGTLLCEDDWRPKAKDLAGLQVVQSHGTEDPILPYSLAEELREMLRAGEAKLEWISFDDGHTIPREAMDAAAKMLERLRVEG
jgi:phospholipase/carboxylesterase